MQPVERQAGTSPALNWRVLSLLNLYRTLVPFVLLGLYYVIGPRGLAVDSPRLFLGTGFAYLLCGLLFAQLVLQPLLLLPPCYSLAIECAR